jgi:exoribonuclease-2
MLPTRSFSTTRCQEGRNRLALSLYVTMDEALAITATATRLEQVPIAANLRHDVLDSTFTKRFFEAAHAGTPPGSGLGHGDRFCTGWPATQGRARSGARQT